MVNPISFTGDTHIEVIAVLANCGTDTDKAKHALITWIQRKQQKGRSTEHILGKLCQIESKFIRDASLYDAFREARAQTHLPRSQAIPLPDFIRRRSHRPTDLPVIDVTRGSYTPVSANYPRSPVSPTTPTASSVDQHSSRLRELRLEPPSEYLGESASYYPPEGSRAVSPSTSYTSASQVPYRHASARAAFYGLNKYMVSPPSRPRSASTLPSRSISKYSMPPANRRSAPDIPLPPVPRPAPVQPIPQSPCSSASASLASLMSPVSPMPQSPNDRYLRVPSPLPTPYSSEETVTTVRDFGGFVPSDLQLAAHGSFTSVKVVSRSDSPLQGTHGNSSHSYGFTGADSPPPYDTTLAHLQSQRWAVGPELDRALKICGDSPAVRREVLKCLCCEPGYETEHWHIRLGDCGLNSEAVDFVILEMCRHLSDVAGET